MANSFINFFKEPPAIGTIKNKAEITQKYSHYRKVLMFALYIGYVVSYIGRKNLSIAMPIISSTFGMNKFQLGLLSSTFYVTYGVGKMVNGILSDKSNVRTFYSIALMCVAFCLFGFVFSSYLGFLPITTIAWIMAFFWGLGGWFHSMTFPPIAKSLSYWFTKKERGLKWSIISTSHQIGVLSGVVVSNFAIFLMGWRGAFYLPGIISLLTGFFLYSKLRDKPASLGLPEVEEYERMMSPSLEEIEEYRVEKEEVKKQDEEKLTYTQMFTKYILVNPSVWILSFAFMFIYIVRTASEDWIVMFFKEKGDSLAGASAKLVVLSIIGATGTMFSGFISEKLFKGKRALVNIIFLIGLLLSLFGFMMNQIYSIYILDYVYAALIGLFCAGLQNLVGLHIVEVCSSRVASAANGFGGSFSYLGAVVSSIATGGIAQNLGWNKTFIFWMICTVAAIILIVCVIPVEKIKMRKKV